MLVGLVYSKLRFNPCCDGLYKRTVVIVILIESCLMVSILVVMDYIKEPNLCPVNVPSDIGFNPCCDGLYKRT